MTEQHKDKIRNDDAPQTGPIPETQDAHQKKTPLPETTDGGRDPSRVPSMPGQWTDNLKPEDEQLAREKEVLEGVDRADNEQRRFAQSPSEPPPQNGG